MSSHYFQIPARKLKQSPPSSHAPPPPPPPPPMYPYHSPSSLTLRAKLSFHHLSPYNNNDTSTTYCYASHSQSQSPTPNLYAAAANRNPRLLYYGYLLRSHSALFQFQPLTTLLIPRRAARVYYKSAAAEEERRCCCCCTCCNCEGILRKAGSWKAGFEKSSEKEGSWRADFGEKERLLGDVAGRGGGRRKWHGVGRVAVEKRGGVGRRVWDVEKESVESWRGSDREERKESVYEELKFCGKKGSTSRRDEDVEFRRDLDRDDREGSVYEGTDVSRKKVGVRGRDVSAKDSSSRREGYGLRIRDEEENVEDWRDSHREEREGYVQEDKVSRLSDRDKYSNYRNASRVGNVDRGESSSSLVNRRSSVDHQAVAGGAEVRKSSLRNSIVERVTNSQRRFEEERVEDREDRHNLVKNVVQVSGDERSQIDQIIVDRTELSKQHGSRQSDSRFRLSDKEKGSSSDNYVEIKGYGGSSSNSRRRFEEERVKGTEDRHNSVKNVVQISGDGRTQIDQRIVESMESNKQYETNRTDSRLHVSDREMANSSKSYLEIKGYNGSSSSSRGHIEEERVEDREHRFSSVKNVVQVMGDERMESDKQKETLQSAYRHLSDKERAITSGSYVEIKEYGGSSSSSHKYRKEERIQGPEDKTTPAVDFVRRGERTQMNQQSIEKMESDEQNKNQTTTTKIHASGSERADNRKSSLQIADERISNLQELSSTGIKNRKETSSQIKETQIGITGSFHGGSSSALESASRLDESSATYVGEFVGKLREESSAFNSFQVSKEETYRGTNQEATIVELNEGKYREEAGRQSSLGSGMKGPSVEMWEVKGMSSSNQPYKIEDPEEDSSTPEVVGSKTSPEITEDTISRRSQRSLWAYIADVMKIGLGHRARSHNSNQKPGTRSSSNESVSSEAWFSGLEPDEDDDEAKKETDTSPKELVRSKQKQLGEQSTQVSLSTSLKSLRRAEQFERGEGETRASQMHVSGLSKPGEEFGSQKYSEVTGIEGKDGILRRRNSWTKELVPIGSFVEQFRPGPSTSLGSMNTGSPSKEGKMGEKVAISSMDETSGSVSVSIPGIVASSISETESVKLPGTKSREIEGEIIIEKVPEIGKTDERDGELKRRKLQRSKQAMKEQFDEWEEAYMLEVEQRKMDEFFMREALMEAKKAADTWEVPVGAVLVQNGKIIARGCNLVEELRDSTAHAEIICIREASNFLRTWRLAETILYVTLEPCAMCAGAILQARVGTVVWGAPNKLLGADGSWVRLFPSGDGGTTSSLDPQNQIAGPVHPFHPKITIRRGILATGVLGGHATILSTKAAQEERHKARAAFVSSFLPSSTSKPYKAILQDA